MGIWNEAFWLMGFLQRSFWEDYTYQESLRYPVYEFTSRLNSFSFEVEPKLNFQYSANIRYNQFQSRTNSFQFQSRSNSEYSWEVQQ